LSSDKSSVFLSEQKENDKRNSNTYLELVGHVLAEQKRPTIEAKRHTILETDLQLVGHVLAELALEGRGEVREGSPAKGLNVDLHACRVSVGREAVVVSLSPPSGLN